MRFDFISKSTGTTQSSHGGKLVTNLDPSHVDEPRIIGSQQIRITRCTISRYFVLQKHFANVMPTAIPKLFKAVNQCPRPCSPNWMESSRRRCLKASPPPMPSLSRCWTWANKVVTIEVRLAVSSLRGGISLVRHFWIGHFQPRTHNSRS